MDALCRHGQVVRRAVGSDDRVDRPAHPNAATGLLVCVPCGAGEDPFGPPDKTTPTFVHAGFKLFFTEDRRHGGRLMSPQEVLALKPRPEYVMYE
jgi:hypothetical protein